MDLTVSIPYFCFMALLVMLAFVEFNLLNHNHRTKFVFIFSLTLFTLFVGLKGWTGMDVMMYYENYQEAPTLGEFLKGHYSKDWYGDFEIGFNLFIVIARSFGMSYWQFQFVYVLVDAIILYYFFRRETNYCVLALLIYFIWWGWVFHAEQLRNANSVLLFMMSLNYVRDKQVFSYVLLNVLGMTFHSTSLVYILVYPLLRITFTKKQLLWIFAVVMIIFVFRIRFINIVFSFLYTYGGQHIAFKIQKYYMNIVYADTYYNIGMRKIIVCFAYIMFFFLPNYFKVGKIDNVIKNVFIIYFVLVFSLCEIRVLQDRGSSLFCIGLVMIFIQYYANLKIRLHKQLYMLCVIALMFIIGFKYFCVESFRYKTCFTAEADYSRFDDELEKRKLEEYIDALKRNKDINKEKTKQLKEFNKIREQQGVEKIKERRLHRQKIERKSSTSRNIRNTVYDDYDVDMSYDGEKDHNSYESYYKLNEHRYKNKIPDDLYEEDLEEGLGEDYNEDVDDDYNEDVVDGYEDLSKRYRRRK